MVVGFTTTCAISAYHHSSYKFKPSSWRGVFDTTLCDKVCQRFAADLWFSQSTPLSSTNKTDRHDITEILLKVASNTITLITLCYKIVFLPVSSSVGRSFYWLLYTSQKSKHQSTKIPSLSHHFFLQIKC